MAAEPILNWCRFVSTSGARRIATGCGVNVCKWLSGGLFFRGADDIEISCAFGWVQVGDCGKGQEAGYTVVWSDQTVTNMCRLEIPAAVPFYRWWMGAGRVSGVNTCVIVSYCFVIPSATMNQLRGCRLWCGGNVAERPRLFVEMLICMSIVHKSEFGCVKAFCVIRQSDILYAIVYICDSMKKTLHCSFICSLLKYTDYYLHIYNEFRADNEQYNENP